MEHYRACSFPSLWTPITNTWPVDAIEWLHLTSAQLLLDDSAIRSLVGDHPFGASAHNLEEVERACVLGARYVMVSPVYPTGSKPGHSGIGLEGLSLLVSQSSAPVFALGGVTPERIAECRAAGACGVATLSHVDSVWLDAALEERAIH